MEIKEYRLQAFIELYKQEFGITLTKSEAQEKALLLLDYVQLCLKPFAKIEEDEIINMRNENE